MPTCQSRPETSARHGRFVCLLFAVLILGACAPKAQQPVKTEGLASVNLESLDNDTAYGEGLKAFWLGDYKNAARIFEGLANRIPEGNFNAKVSYSLACAKLAAAETQDEFNKALADWQDWENKAPETDCPTDPRLLTPILKNYRVWGAVKEQRQVKAVESDCLKRLQDKEKEVINLQKQIKDLEAIHREIQEKKKMTTQ